MPTLTRKQRLVLDAIVSLLEEKGYAPTLEEIGAEVGLSSLATIHVHLRHLEEKGYIQRSHNRGRSIQVLPQEVETAGAPPPGLVELPLLGVVAAGEPIEAIQDAQTVQAPEEFTRGRETFVLRVRGDSMIDEQIRDGDLVIVERRETADNGDTVVALVEGDSATVKKFYRERGNQVRLEPANATMQPIRLKAEDCQIQGVVIGLLRKYT